MKFRVEHTFTGISLEDYEKLHFDEEFNIALCKAVKLSREVVKLENTDERFERRVKVGPDREIPKAVKKVLKADRIEYEEHLVYHWGTYKGTWETTPSVLANKVETKGTMGFTKVATGVKRWSEGEIKVKILGVGGVAEKFIVSDVEKSYDDAAKFTQKWITEHADRYAENA